jgi:hypothetical protein
MARTTATPRWQRVPAYPAPHPFPGAPPEHAPPQAAPPGETPVYEELVREWTAAGRTLPGAGDLEWARLLRFPSPSVLPDPLAAPPPPRRGWLHDDHPG